MTFYDIATLADIFKIHTISSKSKRSLGIALTNRFSDHQPRVKALEALHSPVTPRLSR